MFNELLSGHSLDKKENHRHLASTVGEVFWSRISWGRQEGQVGRQLPVVLNDPQEVPVRWCLELNLEFFLFWCCNYSQLPEIFTIRYPGIELCEEWRKRNQEQQEEVIKSKTQRDGWAGCNETWNGVQLVFQDVFESDPENEGAFGVGKRNIRGTPTLRWLLWIPRIFLVITTLLCYPPKCFCCWKVNKDLLRAPEMLLWCEKSACRSGC